ncbi:MAG: lipopolysaccharide assembly protein LapA domain-containing protein [Gallionellaceae bacterium]|nr:lipopolysaccharide assembly protein LapA domain-containing protein [Gallionellaceae bacterium]
MGVPVRLVTLIAKLILFLLLLAFAVKNGEAVTVRYLMGLEWQVPLSLALLVAFALGALLGLLAASRQIVSGRRARARLRKIAPTDPA